MSEAGPKSDAKCPEADVIVVGAGGAGLPAAISAADAGASVIVVEANYDIGGHAMLSGGRVSLGGGTSWQRRFGIDDSPEQVYLDHTNHKIASFKYSDRELVRTWANENASTFEFFDQNGVQFIDAPPELTNAGSVPDSSMPCPTRPTSTRQSTAGQAQAS